MIPAASAYSNLKTPARLIAPYQFIFSGLYTMIRIYRLPCFFICAMIHSRMQTLRDLPGREGPISPVRSGREQDLRLSALHVSIFAERSSDNEQVRIKNENEQKGPKAGCRRKAIDVGVLSRDAKDRQQKNLQSQKNLPHRL